MPIGPLGRMGSSSDSPGNRGPSLLKKNSLMNSGFKKQASHKISGTLLFDLHRSKNFKSQNAL